MRRAMTDRSGWLAAVRAAALGFVVAVLGACAQQTPEQLLAEAKESLGKNDRNAAAIHLKNLLQKAPNNGEARLLLGQTLLALEDYAGAEKELVRAIDLKQPQEKVLPALARSMLAQEKYSEVIAEMQKYRLFDPTATAVTQTVVGDAYARLGSTTRARGAFDAALAAVPGYPRARLGKATLDALEGQNDAAMKQVDEIIAADPKLAEARAFKADLLLGKGNREAAKKELEAAVDINARLLQPRLALITMLTEDREFDAAAKLLDSTRKLAPADLRVNYRDAVLAFQRGDVQRARQQVQQVLKFLPDNVPALLLSGLIELQEKQPALAEVNLSRAVALQPGHLGARRLLVQIYLNLGQPTRARDLLVPILSGGAIPDDPQLFLLAGETFLATGEVDRAAQFFQLAKKGTEEQQVVARTRLGQIALTTGRSVEGFKELEAAALLNAGDYQADLALITEHLRRNELDKAMAAVAALEKKQPKNPLTFQLYGTVHLAKRDTDAARKNFEKALEAQPTYVPAAYKLAQLDLMVKKPDVARKRYEAMIAKEPGNEQLLIALADLEAETGATPKAIANALQRAVAANPSSGAARLTLVNYLLRTGDAKEALKTAQDALASSPSNERLLELAAAAQEATGEVNQAIGTWNKLASLQPKSPQPLYRLAALYVRQKEFDKAVETLRRVQKLTARERDVVPQIAQIYVIGGRQDEGLRELRELQKREPKFAGAYSVEGDILLAQSKYAEAEKAYREALRLEPQADAVAVKLYLVLTNAGKRAEADAWSRKWLAENPKDTSMRLYLGGRELEAGNAKAALAHFQAVVAADPNNVVGLNNLAAVGGELNDPNALGYGERAAKLAPSSPDVLDTYGMLLVKKGEYDVGLPILERAIKMAPGRNDLRINYAKALIKAGKKGEARRELEALQAVTEQYKGKGEVAALLKSL